MRDAENQETHDFGDFVPVCRPWIGEEEFEAVSRVLRSGWISTGREAAEFEGELSERVGGYVVALSSASAGLILALELLGIGSGDEVIVPAITFVATSHAVLHVGARPVFADIQPQNGLIDPDDVTARLTPQTRAVIGVDLFGQRADLSRFANIPNVAVIRDAAQSFGTPGVAAAAGITTVFSFYATKNVTAGEGGALVTTDLRLAERARLLSAQGVTTDAYGRYHGSVPYDVDEIGYKANLPDVLAAIGRVQLRKADAMLEMRKALCQRYRAELPLTTIDWKMPTNYHLYPTFVGERQRFRTKLRDLGIGTGVHFECIPGHTAYRRLGYDEKDTPNAANFGRGEVTLPTFAGMDERDQRRVIAAVTAALGSTDQA